MMYDDDDIWKAKDKKLVEEAVGRIEFIPYGAKYDQDKLLFGCFTRGLARVIKGVVAVLTYGAQKYAEDSWQSVPNGRKRYLDAFDRHMNSYNIGEVLDQESGLLHIFHAICNLMFVAYFDIMHEHSELTLYKFNKPPENKQ